MKKIAPELRLERVVDALSEDVTLASDAEILDACGDLGIQPAMKGSIAFLGIKKGVFFYPYVPEKFSPPLDPPTTPDSNGSPNLTRRQ